MLKNFKIGKRMGLGFGVVLALMLVIVVLAIPDMGVIHDKLDRTVTINNGPH